MDTGPTGQTQVTTIFIKKGTYKEKLTLAEGKEFVKLLGEDAATPILTYDDYAQKQNTEGKHIGTSSSASFLCGPPIFRPKTSRLLMTDSLLQLITKARGTMQTTGSVNQNNGRGTGR